MDFLADLAPAVQGQPVAATRLRTVGFVGWAVVIGLVLVWEGLGLVLTQSRWPTLSEMLKTITRSVPGRWTLFAFWLWVGWHLFVRGWRFFLQS
jgi:hypothetical protein